MSRISFEFFPPRDVAALGKLDQTIEILSTMQPEFCSVTFGAGGSSKEGTFELVTRLGRDFSVPVASHLTFAGSSRGEILSFADRLWQANVRRIVALRGDVQDIDQQSYEDVPNLIRDLRAAHPFEVAVSAYPEVHPLAVSAEQDLQTLLAKQEAGASSAITQYFFDNSVFYNFVEKARAAGVTIPIVAGVLPIHNFEQVKKMSAKCGIAIPQHVHDAFAKKSQLGADDEEIASELLKAQVYDLACAGQESIHIYTLNRSSLALAAAKRFSAQTLDPVICKNVA